MANLQDAKIFLIRLDDLTEDGERTILDYNEDVLHDHDLEVSLPAEALFGGGVRPFPGIRHGDVVQVMTDRGPFYLFYDQQGNRFFFEARTLDNDQAIPRYFDVPTQFPPHHWWDIIPELEYVRIRPFRDRLGNLGRNSIYLSQPYEQLTGLQGQSMMIPIRIDDQIYYIVDESDFETGVVETNSDIFLQRALNSGFLRKFTSDHLGVDHRQVLSVVE